MTEPSKALSQKQCRPCEGGVEVLSRSVAETLLAETPGWQLDAQATSIRRDFKFKHFVEAVAMLNRIAELAEAQQHHPDLHLTGYRHLGVVLTTHAIGGLSENDFIIAAKVNSMIDHGGDPV